MHSVTINPITEICIAHNQATEQRYAGVPVNMTMFSERLHGEKGYATAHIGNAFIHPA